MTSLLAAAKLSFISEGDRNMCKRVSQTVPGLVLTAQAVGDGLIWDWAYHNVVSTDTANHGYESAAEAVAGFTAYQTQQVESAFRALTAAHNHAQDAFKGFSHSLSALPADIR